MSPTVCCFPPHRQRRRWVPFHSICTCYPSSSTRTGCARHAPGAQWEHQDSYWRAALPCSSQHVFWLQWGLFFHLSSLSSTTKYNGSWTHKNVLAPDSLKCFVGMRTVSHPTLLITFFFFFSFTEGVSSKRRQSILFKVKTASMNLNQSLYPFQWEASQHPSHLLKNRRVSRLCWHLQPSPHNHTATRAEIRLCFSNTVLSHRRSQDLLRQNYARAHASSASLHVSSGNVLIAHSSNTDFQYICKTQQHTC